MSRMTQMTEAEKQTQMIRVITGELTGRRELDIRYLRNRIDNPAIADTLHRILGCLGGTGIQQAAA